MSEPFLDHMRTMVGYWEREGKSKRDALEGLAFSICVMLDGGAAAVGAFMVAPLDDQGEVCGPDIAGTLHEELFGELSDAPRT